MRKRRDEPVAYGYICKFCGYGFVPVIMQYFTCVTKEGLRSVHISTLEIQEGTKPICKDCIINLTTNKDFTGS